jgi:hypothetical protein
MDKGDRAVPRNVYPFPMGKCPALGIEIEECSGCSSNMGFKKLYATFKKKCFFKFHFEPNLKQGGKCMHTITILSLWCLFTKIVFYGLGHRKKFFL